MHKGNDTTCSKVDHDNVEKESKDKKCLSLKPRKEFNKINFFSL